MLEIKKKDELYHIYIDASKMTLLVDELYYNGGRHCSIYDRGNYLGSLWDVEDVKTTGFTFEEIKH